MNLDSVSLVTAAGTITGDIRVNGHPWKRDSFVRVSGYVEQFDVHRFAAQIPHPYCMFQGPLGFCKIGGIAVELKRQFSACPFDSRDCMSAWWVARHLRGFIYVISRSKASP